MCCLYNLQPDPEHHTSDESRSPLGRQKRSRTLRDVFSILYVPRPPSTASQCAPAKGFVYSSTSRHVHVHVQGFLPTSPAFSKMTSSASHLIGSNTNLILPSGFRILSTTELDTSMRGSDWTCEYIFQAQR
jgi:hypothetical protein